MLHLAFSLLLASLSAALTTRSLSGSGPTLTVVANGSKMTGDFQCTGSDDQVVIQQALDQLKASGGTLILSDGTFYLSNQIVLVSNLVFKGQGMQATTIVTAPNAGPFRRAGTIHGLKVSNLVMQDFTGDGNRANNPGNAYTRETEA